MPSSRYLGAKLLDHATGKTEFAKPAKVWIALCTAAPTRSSTGATITEATYTGYKRVEIAAANWLAATAADPNKTENIGAVTLEKSSSGESNVTHFAIVDSATTGAGNVLFYGTFSSPLNITPSLTTVEIPAGELDLTCE